MLVESLSVASIITHSIHYTSFINKIKETEPEIQHEHGKQIDVSRFAGDTVLYYIYCRRMFETRRNKEVKSGRNINRTTK